MSRPACTLNSDALAVRAGVGPLPAENLSVAAHSSAPRVRPLDNDRMATPRMAAQLRGSLAHDADRGRPVACAERQVTASPDVVACERDFAIMGATRGRDGVCARSVALGRLQGEPPNGCEFKMERIGLTAAEAAAFIGVSRAHWLKQVSSGQVPSPFRIGRSVRWHADELRAWAAAGAPPRARWEHLRRGGER